MPLFDLYLYTNFISIESNEKKCLKKHFLFEMYFPILDWNVWDSTLKTKHGTNVMLQIYMLFQLYSN